MRKIIGFLALFIFSVSGFGIAQAQRAKSSWGIVRTQIKKLDQRKLVVPKLIPLKSAQGESTPPQTQTVSPLAAAPVAVVGDIYRPCEGLPKEYAGGDLIFSRLTLIKKNDIAHGEYIVGYASYSEGGYGLGTVVDDPYPSDTPIFIRLESDDGRLDITYCNKTGYGSVSVPIMLHINNASRSLKLILDPDNNITEPNEENNTVTCTSFTHFCGGTDTELYYASRERGYSGPCNVYDQEVCAAH